MVFRLAANRLDAIWRGSVPDLIGPGWGSGGSRSASDHHGMWRARTYARTHVFYIIYIMRSKAARNGYRGNALRVMAVHRRCLSQRTMLRNRSVDVSQAQKTMHHQQRAQETMQHDESPASGARHLRPLWPGCSPQTILHNPRIHVGQLGRMFLPNGKQAQRFLSKVRRQVELSTHRRTHYQREASWCGGRCLGGDLSQLR